MILLHNKLILSLAETIFQTLEKNFSKHNLSLEDIYKSLAPPPNSQLGHFAFPCFPLAKTLKMAPNMIANNLSSALPQNELIKSSKGAGPYLNFFINVDKIGKLIIDEIVSEDFFKLRFLNDQQKIMFEYSQPNTHKELHVGHMRNLCLGNALVRMHRYLGNKVTAATYPGDVGTHVAKCLWYLKFHNKEEVPSAHERGPWLGKMYTLATNKLEAEKGTEQEDKNREILTNILKELEAKKGEYYQLWLDTRKWSIDLMEDIYKWTDVKFDRWYFESEVDSESLKLAQKFYKEGLLELSEGAIGMDLKEEKLGFCIMIKSDGTGMYATKDIALAFEKFNDFNLDQSIYIVDVRQAFHFQQVFKVLEKMNFKNYKNCLHLQYDFVELPDGAMSSRKGNIIPLTDLINRMEKLIRDKYLNKYKNDWSDDEIDGTAKIIANGAIKYGMIRMDNNRKIVFEMNEWLKLDGETGPYLQYVYARINSMCNKLNFCATDKVDWKLLTTTQENALILKLSLFNSIVTNATTSFKTSLLCSYLYELGKLFNNFYANCPIGKAENEMLGKTRLRLAMATGMVMKKGLSVLGIESPSRM